ncbi:MAG TPA: PEP-CTERM sorting domain-containing protein [Candidatus Binatia bacterium]|jgi:hypothetical protein|nr:PEP-CTERM sorting domain-containing protein [Candidatus Binatia bacterium]
MIRKVLFLGAAGLLLGASAAFAFPPIDLTTQDATATSADGTIWTQLSTDPTGTGVYNPFLRLHNSPTEEGLNTDGNANATYDDVGGIWTHSVTLGQLAVINVGGVNYYQFSVDINEVATDGKQYLSLDQLKIYTLAGSGSLTSTTDVVSAGGVLRYNLDGTTDQTVYLNYNLNTGSGGDDAQVLIPTSYFAGASSTDQIYFYTQMGATTGMEADLTSDDGFEEWSAALGTAPPPPSLPEPSTVMILGTGLLGLAATRMRKK